MSQFSLVKDTMVYGLSDLIFKFIAFAVFPIYTLYLSPEDFGIMELVIVLAGLIGPTNKHDIRLIRFRRVAP